MLSVLILATLTVTLSCLWIRRHTWNNPWERTASAHVALLGCALLLMSPALSASLGPSLYGVFRLWNLESLLGHLCLILAAIAMIHHGLTRLTEQHQVRRLFYRQVVTPALLGVLLLLLVFAAADEDYHPDLFPVHVSSVWLGAYWLVLGGLLIYLRSYAVRVFLILRTDSRSRMTVYLYVASAALGMTAHLIQIGTAWAGFDVALPIWLCGCLATIGFAYGSARSWRMKVGWFTPGRGTHWSAAG